jgi:hypothetical protein
MAVAAGTGLHPAVAIAVAEGTGLHPAVAIAVAEGTELRRAVVTEAGAIALHPVADMEEAAAPPEEAAGDHPAVAVAVAVDIPGAAEAMLAVAIHVDVSSTEQVGQRGPEIMGQSVESQNNRVHDVTRGMAAERSKLYSRVHR